MLSQSSVASVPHLTVSALYKRYDSHTVLDDLSIIVQAGEFCLLVGANGAGKTTLLRILAGLVRADSGEIDFFDEQWGLSAAARSSIGYLSHATQLYGDLSATQNLLHYARLYNLSEPHKVVEQAIQWAGLTAHAHQAVRTFSRGMAQRLAIARSTLHQPNLLLLDEPYTGLDPEAAAALDDQLNSLHGQGRTILITAHQADRLVTIASHVALIEDGKIQVHTTMPNRPLCSGLERFLGEPS